MCEPRWACWGLMLTVVAAALAPRAGMAQNVTTPPTAAAREEALVRQIRELEPVVVAARAEAADAQTRLADRMKAGRGQQDTVMVGPLRIVTTSAQVNEARALWAAEWAYWEPILGERGRGLERVSFVYHRDLTPYPYVFGRTEGQLRWVEVDPTQSDRAVSGRIRSEIGKAALGLLPPDLVEWTGGIELGARMVTSRLYRQFAQAPAAVARSCAAGEAAACWTAMGEMEPSADPARIWFTPAEQRAVLATLSRSASALARPCDAGVEESCAAALSRELSSGRGLPYDPAVRASLLWFALERGGAGSLDRLLASVESEPLSSAAPGSAADVLGRAVHAREHLGRAAGMDPDLLVGLWRDQIVAGHPGPPTPDEPTRSATLMWVTLCAAIATRSSRWRLG